MTTTQPTPAITILWERKAEFGTAAVRIVRNSKREHRLQVLMPMKSGGTAWVTFWEFEDDDDERAVRAGKGVVMAIAKAAAGLDTTETTPETTAEASPEYLACVNAMTRCRPFNPFKNAPADKPKRANTKAKAKAKAKARQHGGKDSSCVIILERKGGGICYETKQGCKTLAASRAKAQVFDSREKALIRLTWIRAELVMGSKDGKYDGVTHYRIIPLAAPKPRLTLATNPHQPLLKPA